MAGKPSVSFDKYQEVFKELTALHKKSPTVEEMQKKLKTGGRDLLGKYRAMLRLEEASEPESLTIKPTLAKAIQAEMDEVRNVAVTALNETLRVEREESLKDFEHIEIQKENYEREQSEALEEEREKTRRASVLSEERGREIDRLRAQCTDHQEARRVAEVAREKAVAVSEAELASIERERKANEVSWTELKADLKTEREARHQSERKHSASREAMAVMSQKNHFLQLDNERLQQCGEAAKEVPTLRAVNQVQLDQINDLRDAAKVMSDLEQSQQGEIQQLRKELNLMQRRKDEYKGRAEVAEHMNLEMLKGGGPVSSVNSIDFEISG